MAKNVYADYIRAIAQVSQQNAQKAAHAKVMADSEQERLARAAMPEPEPQDGLLKRVGRAAATGVVDTGFQVTEQASAMLHKAKDVARDVTEQALLGTLQGVLDPLAPVKRLKSLLQPQEPQQEAAPYRQVDQDPMSRTAQTVRQYLTNGRGSPLAEWVRENPVDAFTEVQGPPTPRDDEPWVQDQKLIAHARVKSREYLAQLGIANPEDYRTPSYAEIWGTKTSALNKLLMSLDATVENAAGMAPAFLATIITTKLAGPRAGLLVGGTLEAAAEMENAVASGKSLDRVLADAAAITGAVGALEILPFMGAINKIAPKLARPKLALLMQGLTKAGVETGEEVLEESLISAITNASEDKLSTWEGLKELSQQILQDTAQGVDVAGPSALTSLVTSLVLSAIPGRKRYHSMTALRPTQRMVELQAEKAAANTDGQASLPQNYREDVRTVLDAMGEYVSIEDMDMVAQNVASGRTRHLLGWQEFMKNSNRVETRVALEWLEEIDAEVARDPQAPISSAVDAVLQSMRARNVSQNIIDAVEHRAITQHDSVRRQRAVSEETTSTETAPAIPAEPEANSPRARLAAAAKANADFSAAMLALVNTPGFYALPIDEQITRALAVPAIGANPTKFAKRHFKNSELQNLTEEQKLKLGLTKPASATAPAAAPTGTTETVETEPLEAALAPAITQGTEVVLADGTAGTVIAVTDTQVSVRAKGKVTRVPLSTVSILPAPPETKNETTEPVPPVGDSEVSIPPAEQGPAGVEAGASGGVAANVGVAQGVGATSAEAASAPVAPGSQVLLEDGTPAEVISTNAGEAVVSVSDAEGNVVDTPTVLETSLTPGPAADSEVQNLNQEAQQAEPEPDRGTLSAEDRAIQALETMPPLTIASIQARDTKNRHLHAEIVEELRSKNLVTTDAEGTEVVSPYALLYVLMGTPADAGLPTGALARQFHALLRKAQDNPELLSAQTSALWQSFFTFDSTGGADAISHYFNALKYAGIKTYNRGKGDVGTTGVSGVSAQSREQFGQISKAAELLMAQGESITPDNLLAKVNELRQNKKKPQKPLTEQEFTKLLAQSRAVNTQASTDELGDTAGSFTSNVEQLDAMEQDQDTVDIQSLDHQDKLFERFKALVSEAGVTLSEQELAVMDAAFHTGQTATRLNNKQAAEVQAYIRQQGNAKITQKAIQQLHKDVLQRLQDSQKQKVPTETPVSVPESASLEERLAADAQNEHTQAVENAVQNTTDEAQREFDAQQEADESVLEELNYLLDNVDVSTPEAREALVAQAFALIDRSGLTSAAQDYAYTLVEEFESVSAQVAKAELPKQKNNIQFFVKLAELAGYKVVRSNKVRKATMQERLAYLTQEEQELASTMKGQEQEAFVDGLMIGRHLSVYKGADINRATKEMTLYVKQHQFLSHELGHLIHDILKSRTDVVGQQVREAINIATRRKADSVYYTPLTADELAANIIAQWFAETAGRPDLNGAFAKAGLAYGTWFKALLKFIPAVTPQLAQYKQTGDAAGAVREMLKNVPQQGTFKDTDTAVRDDHLGVRQTNAAVFSHEAFYDLKDTMDSLTDQTGQIEDYTPMKQLLIKKMLKAVPLSVWRSYFHPGFPGLNNMTFNVGYKAGRRTETYVKPQEPKQLEAAQEARILSALQGMQVGDVYRGLLTDVSPDPVIHTLPYPVEFELIMKDSRKEPIQNAASYNVQQSKVKIIVDRKYSNRFLAEWVTSSIKHEAQHAADAWGIDYKAVYGNSVFGGAGANISLGIDQYWRTLGEQTARLNEPLAKDSDFERDAIPRTLTGTSAAVMQSADYEAFVKREKLLTRQAESIANKLRRGDRETGRAPMTYEEVIETARNIADPAVGRRVAHAATVLRGRAVNTLAKSFMREQGLDPYTAAQLALDAVHADWQASPKDFDMDRLPSAARVQTKEMLLADRALIRDQLEDPSTTPQELKVLMTLLQDVEQRVADMTNMKLAPPIPQLDNKNTLRHALNRLKYGAAHYYGVVFSVEKSAKQFGAPETGHAIRKSGAGHDLLERSYIPKLGQMREWVYGNKGLSFKSKALNWRFLQTDTTSILKAGTPVATERDVRETFQGHVTLRAENNPDYLQAVGNAYYDSLTEEQQRAMDESVRLTREVYDEVQDLLYRRGLPVNFVENETIRTINKINDLEKKLLQQRKISKNPEVQAKRDAEYNKKIQDYIRAIDKHRILQSLRYIHIPSVAMEGDQKRLPTTAHERSTLSVWNLIESKKITLSDIPAIAMIEEYTLRAGKDIMMVDIMEAILQDGKAERIATKDKTDNAKPPEGFVRLAHPAFENYWIDQNVATLVRRNVLQSYVNGPISRHIRTAFNISKISQFTNLLVVPGNNFWGSAFIGHAFEGLNPLKLEALAKDVITGGPRYSEAVEHLAVSSPLGIGVHPARRVKQMMRGSSPMMSFLQSASMKDARMTYSDTHSMMKSLRTLMGDNVIVGYYQLASDMVWLTDEMQRVAAYEALKRKTKNPELAGRLVSRMYSDYSDIPKATRITSSMFFFTPSYIIGQFKAWGDTSVEAGKALRRVVTKGWKTTPTEGKEAVKVMMRYAALLVVTDVLMHTFGWEHDDDDKWYMKYAPMSRRYVKTMHSEVLGQDKQLVSQLNNPGLVPLRELQRLARMVDEGVWPAYKSIIHPLITSVVNPLATGTDKQGRLLYNELDDPGTKIMRTALYILGSAIPLVNGLYETQHVDDAALIEYSTGLNKVMDMAFSYFKFTYVREPLERRRAIEGLSVIKRAKSSMMRKLQNNEPIPDSWMQNLREQLEEIRNRDR